MREVSSALFGSEILTGDLEDFPALLSARFPFGKYLVLTDEESAFPVLETLKNLPKKIQLVVGSEDDAVPLFHLSDGITCVVGAGKACSLGRYFAAARALPFVAVCTSPEPFGLFRAHARVFSGKKEVIYPVPPPALVYGGARELSENERGQMRARAFLVACSLSVFCRRALKAVGLPVSEVDSSENSEALLSASAKCFSEDAETLFFAVTAAEYCFRSGYPEGEIFAFRDAAEKISGKSDLLAPCCKVLSDAYALFFESGFYRGGKVDYNGRREAAEKLAQGTDIFVGESVVPSLNELEKYEKNFEEARKKILPAISGIQRDCRIFKEEIGNDVFRIFADVLKLLPELSQSLMPYGIAALMRDFSLL